jgi:arylsulfatase A-like enzyme
MHRVKLGLIILLAGCGLTRPLAVDDFQLPNNEEQLDQKLAYLATTEIRNEGAPNIIWIIVDDLSVADTDLLGEGKIPVPNINKLADQGVRFSNAYVTSPICSPSRAAIFTGRYNQRFGFEHQLHDRYLKNQLEYLGFKYFVNSNPWYPKKVSVAPNKSFVESMGLPTSEITIAEVLKKYGYTTGLFGKWHLSKQPDHGPNNFGFDYFYGFRNSHSLYAAEGTEGIIDMHNKKDWTDKFIWEGQRTNLCAIEVNGEVIEEKRYLTTAITDEGLKFIENTKGPFFTVFSYNAPHTPFQATQAAYAKWSSIKDPVKRTYAAMITTLDDEIGRITAYLKSTSQLKNTLIFFISDNGGAEYTHATDNGDYKGGKITNFDGGLKVPMFITWPDKLPSSARFEHPVSSLDLFATTMAQLTPEQYPFDIDGKDLIKAVSQQSAPHDYLYFRKGYNHSIRSADLKLIWNTETGDSLLYNLANDPYEHYNIYAAAPKQQINTLTTAYLKWTQTLIDPIWPSMIDYHFKDEDGKVYSFDN